jgi:Zn-dependent protease with chaperone function
MVELEAQHYDGRIAIARPARLTILPGVLRCEIDGTPRTYELGAVRLSPRASTSPRFIHLPDGGQLCCEANPELEALTSADRSESLVSWLDTRWWVGLIAIVSTALALQSTYIFGLPWLARFVANRVSPAQEYRLGKRALETFDESYLFSKSELAAEWWEELDDSFERLLGDSPLQWEVEVTTRKAPLVGPNAFTLPGRVIVVTDEMVELCGSQDELTAILAHEIGHVEGRHSLRSMLQNASVSIGIGLLLGDVGSAIALGSVPAVLASLKYSRTMETEADEFAVRRLLSRGIDPENLTHILEKLMAHEVQQTSAYHDYLSSHPDTKSRIAHIREAAKRAH